MTTPCNIHANTHFSISISMKIPLLTTSRCQGSGRSTCTQRQPRRSLTPGSIPPRGSPAMGAPRRRRRGCCQQMSSSSTARFRPTKLSMLPRRLQQQALHAPTKAAAAGSPPTPGHCSWACPRWRGRLAAWTNSEDLRQCLSHLRFLRRRLLR